MAKMTESQLKSQLKEQVFAPVYFLYGDEGFLVRHYADQLCKQALEGGFGDFNLSKFAEKAELEAILTAARMLPAMAEHRVIMVADYEAALSAGEADRLEEYLKAPAQSSVLIFYFIGVSGGKQRKLSALCEKYGASVKFDRRTESELVRMICAGLGKRGCRISAGTARVMIERCGNDLNALSCEMDKLSAFHPGGEITDGDVTALCARTLNADTFDMVRSLARGNLKGALKILGELSDQKEPPVRVFGGLCSSYVNMYRACVAGLSRTEPAAFGKALGLKNPNALKYSAADAGRLGSEKLRRSLNVLDECDRKLKSTSANQKMLLEETLVKLSAISAGK